MNAFEWVGFFVSILSVLFLIGRAFYDAIQRTKNPTKYQAQQEEAERRFKAFLRGEAPSPLRDKILREVVEEDDEEEELEETRGRVPIRQEPFLQKQMQPEKKISFPVLEPIKPIELPAEEEEPSSYVKDLILKEVSKKDMIVLSEILGAPKGL